MKKILFFTLCLGFFFAADAQNCVVTPSPLEDTLNCNESTYIVFEEVNTTEVFSCNGPCANGWSIVGAQFDNPYIPSNSGGTYLWMGDLITFPRMVETPDFNATCGGDICFEFVYAASGGTAPIEQPDEYDEGITLQYSIDGGATWVDMVYYAPNGDTLVSNPLVDIPNVGGAGPFEQWTDVCLPIPAAAQTTAVRFRWLQEQATNENFDHWGIDNLSVSISTPPGIDVYLTNPGGGLVGSTSDSLLVSPTTDSTYVFFYTNNAGWFTFDTARTYMHPTDAGPDVTISCSTIGTSLSVTGVSPTSNVVWTPSTGLSDPNIQNPYANPIDDQMYVVTSDCGTDSTFVNVVPLFTPTIALSSDSICENEQVTLTVTTDQPSASYTYDWLTPVDVDSVASTTSTPINATNYVVQVVSDSGCVRHDSAMVYVGLLPTVNYAGEMRVCRGDSTLIRALPSQPMFSTDFDSGNGIDSTIWADIQNGTVNTNCGSVSGNALHFDGSGNRYAQTVPMNATLGGAITFSMVYGGGSAPCETVDAGEDVQVEYSTDGGVTWTTIIAYTSAPSDGNWYQYSATIPTGLTTNTIFRFIQPNHGANFDHWAIDDVVFAFVCSGGATCTDYTFNWQPAATVSHPNLDSAYFFPQVSTWYTLTVSPEGFNCNAVGDSIFVEVDELPLSVAPSDTFLCEPSNVILQAEIGGSSGSCDGEYALSQIPFYTETPQSPSNLTFDANDDGEVQVSLPFPFEFYCQTVNSIIVQTNGVVNMQDNGGANDNWVNDVIPDTDLPNAYIALLWDDLHTGGNTSTYFVTGTAPNRKFVIDFNLRHRLTGPIVQGQVILHETTNIIDLSCVNCNQDNSAPTATQGIENFDGTAGVAVPGRNNSAWTATNETRRFIPSNSPANGQITWTPNYNISDITARNPLVNPDTTTTYVLNVRNTNNCLFQDSARVRVYEGNTTVSADLSLCPGSTAQLSATGADTYTWTPSTGLDNSNIANPLVTATSDITYYVNYDTEGCTATDSVKITILPVPNVEINNGADTAIFCEGTSKILSTPELNGWTYLWSGAQSGTSNSLNAGTAGTYILTYSDGNCTSTDTIELVESPSPDFDHNSYKNIICCEDDSVGIIFSELVKNVAINQVQINDEVITGVNGVTYTSSDFNGVNLYRVIKITSTEGCSDTAILRLSKNCLTPDFTHPDTVYYGTAEVFQSSLNEEALEGGTTTYNWTTTDASAGAITDNTAENAEFNGVQEGNYTATLQVTSTAGGITCTETSDAKNYEVVVLKDPQYPDAFTPNADNRNDLFRPVMSSLAELEVLKIYNRWGDLMYDASTATNKGGWDGIWNGKLQPSDLYIYYSKIKHPDGKEFIEEGSFMLIR